MKDSSKVRMLMYVLVLGVIILGQAFATQTFAVTVARYGDQNIEEWPGTIGGDLIQAYIMIAVNGPTIIQSVSMYLTYAGSDGTQCMYFGVYQDNGSGSPAGQSLVAFTSNAYCLHGTGSWGPDWQTWKLRASDEMLLPTAGDYWICTLAKETYGSIYHYAYTGAYDYTYGYANYYFAAPFGTGFPTTFASSPGWESNAPYSFYVTGLSW